MNAPIAKYGILPGLGERRRTVGGGSGWVEAAQLVRRHRRSRGMRHGAAFNLSAAEPRRGLKAKRKGRS